MSSAGGSISSDLAEGLDYIEVAYSGTVHYKDRNSQGVAVGGDRLILRPDSNAEHIFIMIGNATGLKSEPVSVMWTIQGNQFPTVKFYYRNDTVYPYEFRNRSIDVQSINEYEQSVINYKTYSMTGIGLTGGLLGSVYEIRQKRKS
jgi:hypothetical protein